MLSVWYCHSGRNGAHLAPCIFLWLQPLFNKGAYKEHGGKTNMKALQNMFSRKEKHITNAVQHPFFCIHLEDLMAASISSIASSPVAGPQRCGMWWICRPHQATQKNANNGDFDPSRCYLNGENANAPVAGMGDLIFRNNNVITRLHFEQLKITLAGNRPTHEIVYH